jgi:hypothetical protein
VQIKSQRKTKKNSNFTFRYIDDVHLLNNSKFGEYVELIYPIALGIKDTADTTRSASYKLIERAC